MILLIGGIGTAAPGTEIGSGRGSTSICGNGGGAGSGTGSYVTVVVTPGVAGNNGSATGVGGDLWNSDCISPPRPIEELVIGADELVGTKLVA